MRKMQKPEGKLKGKLSLGRLRWMLRLLKGRSFEEFQTPLTGQKRLQPTLETEVFWYDYQREVHHAWLNAEHKKSEAYMEWQKNNTKRMR
jgi:hypothetical protein